MKSILTSVSVIAVAAGGAVAGSLDRTGQPINALFEKGGEKGGYAEFSLAFTSPRLSGDGVGVRELDGTLFEIAPGTSYDDVGDSFWNFGAAVKMQFSEQFSGALIWEQPYGTDTMYSGDAATTELGGTQAIADTNSLTALLRYQFTPRWSAHGGVRLQRAGGEIDLSGLAYGLPEATAALTMSGTANGYSVHLDQDYAVGYVVGGAYEIPEIALRVSLTYNSDITHKMETRESGPSVVVGTDPATSAPILAPVYDGDSTTEVKTPKSVNLGFQSGVAEDTLLFGSVRWVEWSEFLIDPKNFLAVTGEGLVELEDTTTWEIGLGRRFSDAWAGSAAVSYEAATDKLVSPLAPDQRPLGPGARRVLRPRRRNRIGRCAIYLAGRCQT